MSKSETEVITVSYHDLLKMYGSEQETAEQRIYIYVQQPHTLKTPHDVAWRDGQVAAEIKRLESMVDDLRDYRVALAQRYAELETMPYTRVLTLKRDPSYKGRITYWVTITRRMSDGTETAESKSGSRSPRRRTPTTRSSARRRSAP